MIWRSYFEALVLVDALRCADQRLSLLCGSARTIWALELCRCAVPLFQAMEMPLPEMPRGIGGCMDLGGMGGGFPGSEHLKTPGSLGSWAWTIKAEFDDRCGYTSSLSLGEIDGSLFVLTIQIWGWPNFLYQWWLHKWIRQVFPHNFLWGSCFWFCIPGASASSSSRRSAYTLTHTNLTQNLSHTISHIHFFTHTNLTYTHTHTQLCHIPSLHTRKLNTQLWTHTQTHTTLSHTAAPHTLTHTNLTQNLSHTISHIHFRTHTNLTYTHTRTTLSHTISSHTQT